MAKGRILVRRHFRNRRLVRAHTRKIKRPKGLNTFWHDGFIHGPRLRQPSKFVNNRVYIVNQDFGKKRHLLIPQTVPKKIRKFAQKENLKLPKDYKDKIRFKVGTLKKNKKLVIQSFVTPHQK